MQFDNDKICKTFKVPAEVIDTIDDQHESRAGKTFTFLVNNAPLGFLKAKNAVAADYLSFLDGAVKAMLCDTESLEKEANMSGKTIKHANFKTFGALPIRKENEQPKMLCLAVNGQLSVQDSYVQIAKNSAGEPVALRLDGDIFFSLKQLCKVTLKKLPERSDGVKAAELTFSNGECLVIGTTPGVLFSAIGWATSRSNYQEFWNIPEL
ncbi:hypothetical protein AB6V67_11650 [Serratia marcescens]|uniref:hypothetical protein n=1 Tax=Serratia marcescens TaxID=615 RepID=UPI001A32663F|nr:hypothetical protein [Serratia marcescens]EMB4112522.1 hypothetical protein [Serratia marcescens]EMB7751819.1 hypothetical protein [Serratia marcescens]MDP8641345.1 hypothetical protein [Serratia marcescens]CAE7326874.1 hypothetical protein AI2617V1_3453 [Serratia marcescens]CAH4002196.1 hypothetical protein AI2617V1_3453 [Serratia marcescens]